MHRVGQTFADARAEAGLTQTQLAELSGVHQSCLSRLEQGNGNATISTLETVAAAMDCKIEIRLSRPSVRVREPSPPATPGAPFAA